ncbi:tetratricopeptide repeat protein [Paenacidovorax monticola]|uniref:Sel1 repeat family protein n=1 Tax=Paenacidovorax monticola TaxID=1926868 RepID=A0A7H0HHB3_9BURK|nr:tetratricopeptide repeat protein [Paenacidovorax monticola]QNP59929.1 sel1 repeat family protein [Paenacidovorax monticola]
MKMICKKMEHDPPTSSYELAFEAATSRSPNLALAKSLLEKAHQNGDPRASYALATWYLYGHGGCSIDLPQAIEMLKIAAEADIASAHFDLAVSYETGNGIRKSVRAAYRHFLAAALNGDNDSYAEVGRCLYHGIGVARDRKSAEIWFRRADALGVNVR